MTKSRATKVSGLKLAGRGQRQKLDEYYALCKKSPIGERK